MTKGTPNAENDIAFLCVISAPLRLYVGFFSFQP